MPGEIHTCAECKQPAELKCSACKLVWYCSKEHQKQHWKQHKNLCKSYEIGQSPELGRFMIASRDLTPGDLIVTESPLVFGPRPYPIEEGPVPCIGCSRLCPPDTSVRCQNCGWQVCDPACIGIRNPLAHGQECPVLCLRKPQPCDNVHDYYRHDALLALRCLLLQRHGVKKWNQLFEMESHYMKRGSGTEIHKTVNNRIVKYLIENFLIPVKEYESQSNLKILHDVSDDTLHKICGIIDVNALETNQSIEMSALYPTAVIMEHNCVPNTYHYFGDDMEQYKITVRAAVPIKKGAHISTMYTHALWGTQARREHLKETKYFGCKCQRCKDPTELGTNLSTLRCLGTELGPCGGAQLPLDPLNEKTEWACSKCTIKLASDQVANLVNQIGEEVDSVQANRPTVKDLEGLLEKMLTFLHPNHYHVYSVKHSLLQLYGYQQGFLPNQLSDDLLRKKATMCRELLHITEKIDPGNARLSLYFGVILHELHLASMDLIKRQWNSGNQTELVKGIREAKALLLKAQDVLKNEVTSGAGTKLYDLICSSLKDFGRWLDVKDIDISE
ncbi:SET and MYND domain containing arthropod-specific member 5 [Carabus blaptoides fortunei]